MMCGLSVKRLASLACVRHMSGLFSPPEPGSRLAAGMRHSVMWISPVGDARSENLPCEKQPRIGRRSHGKSSGIIRKQQHWHHTFDLGGAEARSVPFNNEAADLAILVRYLEMSTGLLQSGQKADHGRSWPLWDRLLDAKEFTLAHTMAKSAIGELVIQVLMPLRT